MAYIEMSDLTEVLKEQYPKMAAPDIAVRVSPLLGLIPINGDGEGKSKETPVIYGAPQGISPSFTKAQANQTGSKETSFAVTTTTTYGFTSISGDAMAKAKSDKGIMTGKIVSRVDGMLKQFHKQLGHALFRDGSGMVAQLAASSAISTTSATLLNRRDASFFEPLQKVQASDDDGSSGSHALMDSGAEAQITKVNIRTGVLTSGSNWTSQISSLGNSDYLFWSGWFRACAPGLTGWCPATDPSSGESFYSVDRSVFRQKLAGTYVDISQQLMLEGLQDACEELSLMCPSDEGVRPNMLVLNTRRVVDLAKSMTGPVIPTYIAKEYTTAKEEKVTIGLKAFRFETALGPLDVLGDPWCPMNRAFALNPENLSMEVDGQPDLVSLADLTDSSKYMAIYNADAYEFRAVSRSALRVKDPSAIGHFLLPTASA